MSKRHDSHCRTTTPKRLCLSAQAGLTDSDYIAIFAGIVALLSLATLLVQTIYIGKHNKKITRPILDASTNQTVNQAYYFKIHNFGLGPAIIENAYLFVDEEKFDLSKTDKIYDAFSKVNIDLKLIGHKIISITNDSVIIAGGEITLIEIFPFESIRKSAQQVFPRMRIEVAYKSIYDERFNFKNPLLPVYR